MELACPPGPRLLRASASFFGLVVQSLESRTCACSLPLVPAKAGPQPHSASKTRVNALMAWIPAFAGMNGVCCVGWVSEEAQAARQAPPEPRGAGIWLRACPLDSFDGLTRVLQ